MSLVSDYENDEDGHGRQSDTVNNIELLATLENRFQTLLDGDLDGAHLYVDKHFFQVLNALQFERFVKRCANVNLLTTTFTASKLDRLSVFDDRNDAGLSRLVIMIASYLWDYSDAIKMLLSHHSFDECIILCGMSELSHISHPHPSLPSLSSKSSMSSAASPTSSATSPSSSSANSKVSGLQLHSIYQRFQNDFSESAHVDADDDGDASQSFRCTIRYFPSCYMMVTPNYFVLPTQSSVFPPLYFTGMQQQLNQQSQSSLMSSSVRQDLKQHTGILQDIHLTTHSLLSFMSELKLGSTSGEDLSIYPVGSFATYLANEIHTVLSTVHKDQTEDYHPVSIVLVDRYLDLVGPCSHSENALDRILQTSAASASSHSQMPEVNISPVYSKKSSRGSGAGVKQLYRIFGAMNMQGDSIWVSLANKTLREAVVLLKRRVVDIVSMENINIDITSITSTVGGAMNPNSLVQLVELLNSHGLTVKYRDDIQALCAVIETLQCSSHQHWDNLLSLEKILLLSAGYSNNSSSSISSKDSDDEDEEDEDEEESLLSQISEIVNSPISSSDETKYPLREIIALCLFAFSLVGDKSFSNDDQSKLINSLQLRIENLTDAEKNDDIYKSLFSDIFEQKQQQHIDDNPDEDEDQEEEEEDEEVKLRERLNLLLDVMEIVARSRKNFVEFASLLRGGMSGSTYKSFMSQLLVSLLEQSENKEIKALERFNPSKLGSLLGFGWGRSKKLQRVVDTRKIIFYVLGGLTFSELKELQDTIDKTQRTNKSLSQHQILIGGTCIATNDTAISGITKVITSKLNASSATTLPSSSTTSSTT